MIGNLVKYSFFEVAKERRRPGAYIGTNLKQIYSVIILTSQRNLPKTQPLLTTDTVVIGIVLIPGGEGCANY